MQKSFVVDIRVARKVWRSLVGGNQVEKVLIFSSREICYSSGNFFAHQLAAAFEELGFLAEVCEIAPDDDLDAALAPLLSGTYRLAVDFNSMLPRMELEDGSRYLDRLRAPFFDYILDHPLFHYTGLTSGVRNLHALVLDEAQEAYVREYYTGVADVHTLPLGATRALYDGERDAECRILFPGTYDDPESVYAVVEASDEPLRRRMKRLIERRVFEPLVPMEQAFREELAAEGTELEREQFALLMNGMYAVDAYVRDYFRKKALDTLLAENIPVTVMGTGWEKYREKIGQNLRRERSVPFGLSFERIAKAQILLNVSPIFNRGMHDRIVAGMANGAVVLTDGNPYLEKHFANGREMCFYSLTDDRELTGQAELLLADRDLREQIAERAYREFAAHHTWRCRAEQILAWADECAGMGSERKLHS